MKGDNPTELEGKWRVDGTWIDPKRLIAGRKEEMEYMMKIGVMRKSATTTVASLKGEKCRS